MDAELLEAIQKAYDEINTQLREAFNTGMASAEAKLLPQIQELEKALEQDKYHLWSALKNCRANYENVYTQLEITKAERDELKESNEVRDSRNKGLLNEVSILKQLLSSAGLLEMQYSTAQRYKAALQAVVNCVKHWRAYQHNPCVMEMLEIAEEGLKEVGK